ncbi:hypothetical protein B5G43_16035 [Flavonifractor sp. An92]|nr:hypothetical protein B5G43_16035 [Flavonifractor sp. An92]OUQ18050.1 hypothetical protein B5E80_18290 [Flavonifractor sp. An135]
MGPEGGSGVLKLWMVESDDAKRAAHALLEQKLSEYGVPRPEFDTLPGGKPILKDGALHFSLSHSGAFALCGLGKRPLGVDVERIKPRRPNLPRYALSEREFQWFTQRGSNWEDFYTLWTLKESYVKYTGSGLDRAARSIEVPLLSPGEEGQWNGLWFRAWGGTGWRAACCGEERPEAQLILE